MWLFEGEETTMGVIETFAAGDETICTGAGMGTGVGMGTVATG